MPNWIVLTGADIRLLDTEITMMAAVQPAQNIDNCVLSASNFVRGYVAGGGNILEPAPAIPPECKDDAIAIARYSYLAQDPTGTLLTPIRQKERDDAYKHLVDIAKDVATITQADVPTTSEQFGKWGSATKIDMRTDPALPTTAAPVLPVGFEYHKEIIAVLTSAATPALDGLSTTMRQVLSLVTIVITVGGIAEEQTYRLDAGSANPADPGQVKPLDWNLASNNKFWNRVG